MEKRKNILMNFSREVGNGLRSSQLDFGADLKHHLDPGFLVDRVILSHFCEVSNKVTDLKLRLR